MQHYYAIAEPDEAGLLDQLSRPGRDRFRGFERYSVSSGRRVTHSSRCLCIRRPICCSRSRTGQAADRPLRLQSAVDRSGDPVRAHHGESRRIANDRARRRLGSPKVGPCRFGRLGARITVQCPLEFDALMLEAGAVVGSRRAKLAAAAASQWRGAAQADRAARSAVPG